MLDQLDKTLPAMERSLAIVEKVPALVTAERHATIKALSDELTRAIDFLKEERITAIKQITIERTAAVRDVGDILTQQRQLLAQDIDATTSKAVEHAFYRAALLCIALLLATFLGLVVLIFLVRRVDPRTPASPRNTEKPPREFKALGSH